MGGLVTKATDFLGLTDSKAGERAAKKAGKAAVAGQQQGIEVQREALEYLKQQEALPSQFREGALTQLGGLAGIAGGDPMAAQRLQSSPLYQATIGQLPQQEEAILRNQSATGALRGGGTDMMLANNQRMNQLQAYQNAMQPLQGLAGLGSNINNIAGAMQGIGNSYGNMGNTQANAITGAASSLAAGQQAAWNNTLGVAQLGLAAFCDPALKDNVTKLGEYADGLGHYSWTWNDKAAELGLHGEGAGPMADEVQAMYPDIVERRNGYLYINGAQS